MIGTGDFNKDGLSDILWRNAGSGQVSIWDMNGNTKVGGGPVLPSPGTVWTAVGTGDFNGDGFADILWQNRSTGQVSIWEMDGTARIGGGPVASTLGPEWKALGTGDFNKDGFSDILFQDVSTGQIAISEMDGQSQIGGGPVNLSPGLEQDRGRNRRLQRRRPFRHPVAGREWAGVDLGNGRGQLPSAAGRLAPNPGPSWRAV